MGALFGDMKSKLYQHFSYIEDQSTWQRREDTLDAITLREVSARRFAIQPANSATAEEIQKARDRRRRLGDIPLDSVPPAPDATKHTSVKKGDRFIKNGACVDVHDVVDGWVFYRVWPSRANKQPIFESLFKAEVWFFLSNVQGAEKEGAE